MKPITMYEAVDGSRHETKEKAEERDNIVRDCELILSPLFGRPDDGGFSNGAGYVQQSPDAVRMVKQHLLGIAKLVFPSYAHIWDAPVDEVHPFGVAGRIIDEGPEPLRKAWYRLMCIDTDAREWGQPYYALHPEHGQPFAPSPPRAAG